jgi:hypothetical protein
MCRREYAGKRRVGILSTHAYIPQHQDIYIQSPNQEGGDDGGDEVWQDIE